MQIIGRPDSSSIVVHGALNTSRGRRPVRNVASEVLHEWQHPVMVPAGNPELRKLIEDRVGIQVAEHKASRL